MLRSPRTCAVVVVVLVLSCLSGIAVGQVVTDAADMTKSEGNEPWFYHGLEGPGFTVVSNTSAYTVRQYPESYWSATTVTGKSMDKAGSEAFMRLFRYISGANEKKQKIEMTVPVLASVIPGQGPFCEENFTYHFYLPRQFQNDPPKPTDPTVSNSKMPPMTVAVSSYSGWSDETKVIAHGSELFEQLKENGVNFDSDKFFWAGYDSPFRLIDRHNEVWATLSSSNDA